MHRCLNRQELTELIALKSDDISVESDTLQSWINNAENWHFDISSLTYLLTKILERKTKEGEDCYKIINVIYDLERHMSFSIQEIDAGFVDYMLRNKRTLNISLEEDLVELQNNLTEYQYGKTLRY